MIEPLSYFYITGSTNTMNDVTLLDDTLDDLADLPQSKPFPAGAYLVDLIIRAMENKPGAYVVNMKHKETLELADATEEEPKQGDESPVFLYTRKKDGDPNPIGQGQFKAILLPLAERLGTRSVAEIVNATAKGVEVAVVVKVKKSREDYPDSQVIVSLELPE